MTEVEIRSFLEPDRRQLVGLWERCDLTRSWNDPDLDIDRKVGNDDGLLVAVLADGSVVGSVMAGYDGHRGWINYLAVDPSHRRSGLGHQLMQAAVRSLAAQGCAKVNLQIRGGNDEAVAFYESIGFTADPVISMGKRLVDDGE